MGSSVSYSCVWLMGKICLWGLRLTARCCMVVRVWPKVILCKVSWEQTCHKHWESAVWSVIVDGLKCWCEEYWVYSTGVWVWLQSANTCWALAMGKALWGRKVFTSVLCGTYNVVRKALLIKPLMMSLEIEVENRFPRGSGIQTGPKRRRITFNWQN